MAKTVGQIVSWVDTMIPNSMDSTTKFIILEDIWKDIKQYNTEYVVSDTTPTASSQATYGLPTGVHWKDVVYVGVSNTTFNSTNIVASTTPFTEYVYKSLRHAESGALWWEYTSTSIRLDSIPDDAYHMRIRYMPSLIANASSDSTTVIPGNDEMVDYMQNKLASMVAKAGAFPRVDLANNYELEAQDVLTKVRIASAKFKWHRNKDTISYQDWW